MSQCRISSANKHSFAVRVFSLVAVLFLVSCATRGFHPKPVDSVAFKERAVSQSDGDLWVSAAVPGEEEAEEIFGAPLYKRGIQPVWLEIENKSDSRIRFAPTGVDRNYFSPLEVAYMHKSGLSKSARSEMEKWYYDLAMPRQIPAGATRSGFVFTNASPGTKSFSVDLFGAGSDHSLAFFVDVPGFVPDHAQVEFERLYDAADVRSMDEEGIRQMLTEMPCCTTDQTGAPRGPPVNIAIIGSGSDILRALLRANWRETSIRATPEKAVSIQYLFGRRPDAVFRIQRDRKRNRNVMSLWLSPHQLDGEPIWLAQITHFIGQDTQLEELIFGARVDPDVDDSRSYLLQNLWYSQSLRQVGWIKTNHQLSYEVNAEAQTRDRKDYFTDGVRMVLWLSGKPVSLTEVRRAGWDEPPPR